MKYLWKRILSPGWLTEILENNAQVVAKIAPNRDRNKKVQIFQHHHQQDAERKLLSSRGAETQRHKETERRIFYVLSQHLRDFAWEIQKYPQSCGAI